MTAITTSNKTGEHTIPALFAKAVFVVFLLLSALLVISPLGRRFGVGIPYDRLCELSMVLLIALRLLAARRMPLPTVGFVPAAAIFAYFTLTAVINYASNSYFDFTLLLLDGKFLLPVLALWLFQNVRLNEQQARQLTSLLFCAFLLAIALFAAFPSKDRLALLDESNYMMLAFTLTSLLYLDAYRAKVLSPRWLGVFGALTLAAVLAQSRTSFAFIAVIAALMLFKGRRTWVLATAAYVMAIFVFSDAELLLDRLSRGQTNIENIDRFIFLQEFLLQMSLRDWLTSLFGNNVGTYVTLNPQFMGWWVNKFSIAQDIPYGLAPFVYHVLYLRVLACFGLIGGALVLLGLLKLIWPMNNYVVWVILISGISMSVFYLSSVMPFLVLALVIRPALASSETANTSIFKQAKGPNALLTVG